MNVASKNLEQLRLGLNQGEVLYAGGCRGRVPPAPEQRNNRSDVYLRNTAPGDKIDPVIHAGQCEYDVNVLDIAEFMHQHGKIAHVPVDRNRRDANLYSLEIVTFGGKNQFVQQVDLFRRKFLGVTISETTLRSAPHLNR